MNSGKSFLFSYIALKALKNGNNTVVLGSEISEKEINSKFHKIFFIRKREKSRSSLQNKLNKIKSSILE